MDKPGYREGRPAGYFRIDSAISAWRHRRNASGRRLIKVQSFMRISLMIGIGGGRRLAGRSLCGRAAAWICQRQVLKRGDGHGFLASFGLAWLEFAGTSPNA